MYVIGMYMSVCKYVSKCVCIFVCMCVFHSCNCNIWYGTVSPI